MQMQTNISYQEVYKLVNLLNEEEKLKLFQDLKNKLSQNEKRKFGKYDGQGWISDDFDKPLDDFKEYMK